MTYISLFFISFVSASLLPMGSEAFLVFNIKENYNIYLLLLFATLGNTLGSLLNYFLGLKGEEYLENKKYLDKKKIAKYRVFFDKYGAFSLLLSWVPIIGDPLTFIAGVLKYNLKFFIVIVLFAKFIRYLFVTLVTLSII
ncbi:YqaA family protein [Malaciobacter marinus]|jgi:membrane protein YqaA with SNARE-associated domain|uniref:Membrane protein YqaA with SNARE-associated domain n=1 Tax=Malaciobacter marinus TaxID=505249 RepID=A0AB36ZZU4_9BACT|nr:YqaA family protein [Malaciobacter marinus]PPK62712.1 membrane protein YqaA with SNARE-associated domain [Malaciobacter marinus]